MRSPIDRARERMEQWAEARAMSRLAPDAAAPDAAAREARVRRALASGEVREALSEAASARLLGDDEHAALLAQLALAARDEAASRAGLRPTRIDASVRIAGEPRLVADLVHDALEHGDRAARVTAFAALSDEASRERQRALEVADQAASLAARIRARGPASVDRAPEDLRERAARFLDATDDAAHEALARAVHAIGAAPPSSVLEALGVLRAPALDALVSPGERGRRLGAQLAPLRLSDALARVRLASAHRALDPTARVVPLAPPRRVEIAPSVLELGLASELELSRALGEALAFSLVAPALPAALRRARPGSVARAIGLLVASLHADPLFVLRSRGLEGRAAEAYRRVATSLALARARVLAAWEIAGAAGSDRERVERGASLVARALAVREPAREAWPSAPVPEDPEASAAELRAALLVPAITAALRERHDEDWFRNPRAAEALRAAASRGGSLAVEAWAEELGATPEAGIARLVELAR